MRKMQKIYFRIDPVLWGLYISSHNYSKFSCLLEDAWLIILNYVQHLEWPPQFSWKVLPRRWEGPQAEFPGNEDCDYRLFVEATANDDYNLFVKVRLLLSMLGKKHFLLRQTLEMLDLQIFRQLSSGCKLSVSERFHPAKLGFSKLGDSAANFVKMQMCLCIQDHTWTTCKAASWWRQQQKQPRTRRQRNRAQGWRW